MQQTTDIPALETFLDTEVPDIYYIPTAKSERIINQVVQNWSGEVAAGSYQVAKRRTEEARKIRRENMKNGRDYSPFRGKTQYARTDNIANCVTATVSNFQMVFECIIDDQGRADRTPPVFSICPTLRAFNKGNHPKRWDGIRYRLRNLTPTEYGRLQGFPMDTWKQVVSDTQAYKQFGNAVTVTIAKAMGQAIKNYLEEVKPC
jgi:site-specific DNA-cytosine methylase